MPKWVYLVNLFVIERDNCFWKKCAAMVTCNFSQKIGKKDFVNELVALLGGIVSESELNIIYLVKFELNLKTLSLSLFYFIMSANTRLLICVRIVMYGLPEDLEKDSGFCRRLDCGKLSFLGVSDGLIPQFSAEDWYWHVTVCLIIWNCVIN